MSIVPGTRIGKVEFFEARQSAWSTNAVAMGSSAPVVTAWAALVTAARQKFEAQQEARSAAKVATVEFNDAVAAMARAGADIIRQVKAKAGLDGNNTPYNLSMIPPPAIPGPSPAPGMPFAFKVSLQPDGSVEFGWKCTNAGNAHGVMYQISRRTAPTAEFTFLGTSGQKKFVDSTLPAGSSQVTYRITAVRSTASGTTAEFNVNFGVGGGGEMTATVEPVGPGGATPKIAA